MVSDSIPPTQEVPQDLTWLAEVNRKCGMTVWAGKDGGSGVAWVRMEGQGVAWIRMEGQGVAWVRMEGQGVAWVKMEGQGVAWVTHMYIANHSTFPPPPL